jgi:pyridoxamine 5'-phosphate oxidase
MAISEVEDPIALFRQWLADAEGCTEVEEPTAMTLATVDENGEPDARVVLLKGCDEHGFVFYTNLTSPKARQLQAHPRAALCFHWAALGRQVRVSGAVEPVSDQEADAYFATRPRLSQIGAWASQQSQPLVGRFELETRIARFTAQFHVGPVPRPPFWSGFRLLPRRIEFWLKLPYRLHDRVQYVRSDQGPWHRRRLYP